MLDHRLMWLYLMSAPNHFFISYSRKQFYFVESLVIHLQKNRVQTWFDVKNLKPGSNWEESWREGCTYCVGFILVASRASITSTNVQEEWKQALEIGKPIYVVLFEPVQLPPELKNVATIIDFRGNFKSALSRLLQVTQQRVHYHDPLPRVNILKLPIRLPASLWCITSVLWFCSIVNVVFFFHMTRTFVLIPVHNPLSLLHNPLSLFIISIIVSGLVIFTFYSLYYSLAFTYRWRGASYQMIRIMLWGIPLGLLGLLLLFYSVFDTDEWSNVFLAINLSLLAIGVLSSLILPHLDDVARWFPTGTLPEKVRRRKNVQSYLNFGVKSQFVKPGFIDTHYKSYENEDMISLKSKKTYWLHYDTKDEEIAIHILEILNGMDWLSKKRGVTVDIHIILLTSVTPRAWLNTVMSMLPQGLYIVASSVCISKEEKRFHNIQWIDYRFRQRDQFEHQFERVRELLDKPFSRNNVYDYPKVPEDIEKFVVPPEMLQLSRAIGSLSMYALSAGIYSFFSLFLHHPIAFAVSIIFVSSINGFLSIWLHYQINTFNISYIALPILLVITFSNTIWAIMLLFPYTGNKLIYSSFALMLYLFIRAHKTLKKQLPRHTRFFSRQPTLSIPLWRRDLLIYIFLLITVIEIAFFRITLSVIVPGM
jgi:TIR domain